MKKSLTRNVCENLGYVKKSDIVKSFVANGSVLNMPQFPNESVQGLVKCFSMYVNFPEDRWDQIKIAEANTKEGNREYNNLKEEYMETFWKDGISFEESALHTGTDIHDHQEAIPPSLN